MGGSKQPQLEVFFLHFVSMSAWYRSPHPSFQERGGDKTINQQYLTQWRFSFSFEKVYYYNYNKREEKKEASELPMTCQKKKDARKSWEEKGEASDDDLQFTQVKSEMMKKK